MNCRFPFLWWFYQRTNNILIFIVSLSIVGLNSIGCWSDNPVTVRTVDMGLRMQNVKLLAVSDPQGTYPNIQHLVLSGAAGEKRMHNLNELYGLIRIPDPAAALHFVRLKTSLATWQMWPSVDSEIVQVKDARKLPNYGLTNVIDPLDRDSGFNGMLSTEAYRAGRFTPPMVQQRPGGFRVRRWLYTQTQRFPFGRVQLVEERVSTNGAYKRVVLKDLPPPDLPGTRWHFMGFK